jgi:hypothetical protein
MLRTPSLPVAQRRFLQVRHRTPVSIVLWALVASLWALPASHAARYRIRPDGTGDFPTIQAGIDAVVDGDSLDLVNGTFTGDGNWDITYQGKAILIRSSGGEPDSCIIDCGGWMENHQGVLFLSGEGPNARLEGVTIRQAVSWEQGGAVVCSASSPTLTNCHLTECSAWEGTGLYCDGASPQVIDCLIDQNAADYVEGCGGGACCRHGSHALFVRCTFRDNHTMEYGEGAGAYCDYSSPGAFVDCGFSDNAAHIHGGGLACQTASLTNCNFLGNSAIMGGAIACWDSTLIQDCTFMGNAAIGGYIHSPAENIGGAVIAYGVARVMGCTFAHNTAEERGGGLCCASNSPLTLDHCTFYGNGATPGGGGGIYYWFGAPPTIENTIVAFSDSGEAVACGGGALDPVLVCCDLFGNADGDWVGCVARQYGVAGNISADPLFCDAPAGDFGLDEASPCRPFSPPNSECDLIGARPVGCTMSVPDPSAGASGPEWTFIAPNPTRSSTRLVFSTAAVPADARGDPIAVAIFDAAGRFVRKLEIGGVPGGVHEIVWDGRDTLGRMVSAGVYLAKLRQGTQQSSRAIIVMR